MSIDHNKPFNKDPVASYGIVLFYVDKNNIIWYLLAQRRDTIEYVNYLRGIYSPYHLNTYFKLMTPSERYRLEHFPFDKLWDDLWINHDNRYYRDGKEKARIKYEAATSVMKKTLQETESYRTEPGWCFPKGRKNPWETDVECAFREFKEETKLNISYRNLINITPLKEVFRGSNGKMYATIYYVAQSEQKLPIHKIPVPDGLRSETISEEIANLQWMTMVDALKVLPPWRQNLLLEANDHIKKFLKAKS